MFCPKCGQNNKDKSTFCVFCGEKLQLVKKKNNSLLSMIATEELVKQASVVPLVPPVQKTQEASDRTLQEGRYTIARELGEGGMGKVYLARDEKMEFDVVVKEMLPYLATPKEREYIKKHFKEEAKMLFRLKHQGLPRVTDYFFEGNSIYIIMEYIKGEDLESIIKKSQNNQISIDQFFNWIINVLHILGYLHNQDPPIIHRDIKPGNIMVTPDNKIVLVDFGVAKSVGMKTGTHTRVGTPGFASPEHFFGKFFLASDIYSLGATFHYLLSGDDPRSRNPFDYPQLSKYRDDVPDGLQEILNRMLETEIDVRYEKIEDVIQDLLKISGISTPAIPGQLPAVVTASSTATASMDTQASSQGAVATPVITPGSTVKWKKMFDVLFESSICSISFSPDGTSAACGTGSNDVKIINAESGQFMKSFMGHIDWIRSVDFSPDGKFIISGSDDKTIRVWELESGKSFKDIQAHSDWIRGVSYSPDGNYFVTGSYDCLIKIWSTRSWRPMITIDKVVEAVNSVKFAPDGQSVASASDDATIYLWHARTGEELAKFEGHDSYVYCVAFSPDGKYLASGSGDQT
ncbi:MAG: protein kinase domain-containing protein, partial [Vulcanimicrobiota bacterium]